MVTVIFGDMRTKMRAERLERAEAPKKQEAPSAYMASSKTTRDTIDNRRQQFHQDIDVRGMRGDEAINAVMYFIDYAILVGMSRVRILHGTGKVIIRSLMRDYLATVPNVAGFRDEHVQFGGAGITVVDWIKLCNKIKKRAIPVGGIALFLSLLSDSNQRPRDYKSRALAN